MKMNSAQIERTLEKLNTEALNAQAIPAEHPLVPQLERLFGSHTYILDARGLSIVEPIEEGEANGRLGMVVSLARWTDDSGQSLQPHQPEATSTVVDLETDSRQ